MKQQDHFASFLPHTPEQKYVNGETHLYLGRQYKLKAIPATTTQVKVYRGCIEVHSTEQGPVPICKVLEHWCKAKAKEVFTGLLAELLDKTPSARA